MVDQDCCHSDIMAKFLRHVTSSPNDAGIEGDIFRPTIYPPSVVVIALISSEKGRGVHPIIPFVSRCAQSVNPPKRLAHLLIMTS